MFGRGVISTQYGWAFEKAGHTVEFYVRPGRKAEYGSAVALDIFDARKKIRGVAVKQNWPVVMVEDLTANNDYDLIILSVQHYHINNAADFLHDKIGKATVFVFNNFWEEPQEALSKLPQSQLVWGFPQAGGGFNKNGVLRGAFFKKVNFGTFGTTETNRGNEVQNLFRSAGFTINEYNDFRSWLFIHFAVDAALHFQTLKTSNLTSLEAIKTTSFWRNVILNGKELLPLLKARNVNLKASPETKLFSLPPWLLSSALKLSLKFLPPVKQIFEGHSNSFELKSYCQDVMATAEELKVSLPRFENGKRFYQ